MANSPQAKKRVRQQKVRELHNASQKSAMRTAIKKVLKLIEKNEIDAAQQQYQQAARLLDMAAGRRVIHKNKAARIKSRLVQRLKKAA